MASVRARALVGIGGDYDQLLPEAVRVLARDSRERASRLPMRFTATRNASSVASPASTRTAYLLAQVVSNSATSTEWIACRRRVAPPSVDLLLERYRVPFIRHRSDSLWQRHG